MSVTEGLRLAYTMDKVNNDNAQGMFDYNYAGKPTLLLVIAIELIWCAQCTVLMSYDAFWRYSSGRDFTSFQKISCQLMRGRV